MINAYEPRLDSDYDNPAIADRLLMAPATNELQTLIEERGMTRQRRIYDQIDNTAIEVPNLYPTDFRELGGNYQLLLAKSYYGEHRWSERTGYQIDVARETFIDQDLLQQHISVSIETPLLLRARLKSRHSSSKEYQVFVLYDKSRHGSASVVGAYCQCKAGSRTTDLCAHAMCIVWYYGYAAQLEHIATPGEFLQQHFPQGIPQGDDDETDHESDEYELDDDVSDDNENHSVHD